MLEVEFKFTPAGKFAGDPYVQVRILNVSDNGDESEVVSDWSYLCDDCAEDGSEDSSCPWDTPQGVADEILSVHGFERRSEYTFCDLEGFEQSADLETFSHHYIH